MCYMFCLYSLGLKVKAPEFMALCPSILRRSSVFIWSQSSNTKVSLASMIKVRFRKGELPSGIWSPNVFKNMKKPRQLTKEFVDFLVDGTCRTPINFGVHEGMPLGALSTEYLVWLSNDFRSDTIDWRWWRDAARQCLKERQSVRIEKRKEFIAALIRAGNVEYTLELLRSEANQVDRPQGYAALIIHCSDTKNLEAGIKVHNQIAYAGFSRNPYLSELLIEMYGRCNMMDLALQAFEAIPKKLVSSWTALIRCYVDNGEFREAIEAYKKMDVDPDQELLIVMFDCCSKAKALAEGKVIHACLLSSEVRTDLPLRTAIFQFYAVCGALDVASNLFINLEKKKAPTWNLMIEAYVQAGKLEEALNTYRRMDRTRTPETYLAVLGACTSVQQIKSIEADFLASKLSSTSPEVKLAIQLAKDSATAIKQVDKKVCDGQEGSELKNTVAEQPAL